MRWIQTLSNVSKSSIFLHWKKIVFFPLVTDTIYIFTVAKLGSLGNFGPGNIFQKVLIEIYLLEKNATHVVTSISNIITSLFDLA